MSNTIDRTNLSGKAARLAEEAARKRLAFERVERPRGVWRAHLTDTKYGVLAFQGSYAEAERFIDERRVADDGE